MHGLALIVVALVCYQTSASIEDEAKRHYKVATGVDWTGDTKFTIASNDDFEEFVRKYQKQYSSSIERLYRQRIFQINSWLAQAYESTDQGTAKYGITPFSDMSAAEFKQYYANLKADMMEPPTENAVIPNIVAPKSVDWRTKGAVTPVKNQQQCGSCWSFSTTGNIEGQWFIHKGTLLSLSEQQLVDCDKTSYGCNGGWPTHAYPYIKQAGGIESEQDYPYTARDGNCRFDPARVVARVQSYVNISHKEDDMATWCAANGPVSILLNANEMQLYRGGIAHPTTTTCNPKNLDHAVLIVGYGVDTQQQTPVPFWIVKNSWGPQWGEEGYWRVYRGGGVCGLNSAPSSAVV